MVARTISHYEILRKLGEGGMGQVYLARDVRLDRTVALKVLPAEFAQDERRRKRLEREARAASALNHPNITHIYDIGEAGDVCFIAMEHVEGESLQARLANGPLKATEILDIGIQLADALAEAHAHGITHRDIKPANIMLTSRGQVKVLDFGLAKTSPSGEHATDTQHSTQTMTQEGAIVGTFPYMSPEQATGRPVDSRTDLFSLGVVLYEMAAGRRPFEGRTPAETIGMIAGAEPEPIARSGAAVPGELERIVRKCLEKDPERRYQGARDILVDLRNLKRDTESGEAAARTPVKAAPRAWLYAAVIAVLALGLGLVAYLRVLRPAAPAVNSLAVLPFENESGDAEVAYLCDGLSESLINSLAQLPDLKVISRSSAFRFRKELKDPQSVGRKLDVQAVVVGRVLHRQDRLLVSAELVDVRDQRQLWGGRYDRRFQDVMDIEADLARAITGKLRLKLTGEQAKLLTRRHTDDPEAYRLYLKALHSNQSTRQSMESAAQYLREAIQLQPDYAAAYAMLSYVYGWQATHAILDPRDGREKATFAARKALDLNDELAEAHAAAATVKVFFDWDWAGAERECRRAIELSPGSADVHRTQAYYFGALGRFDDAVAACRKAQELDPFSILAYHDRALSLMGKRDYGGAIAEFQRALDLNPNWTWGYIKKGLAYTHKGMIPEALAAAARAEDRLRGSYTPLHISWLGHLYAACGEKKRAREALRQLEEFSKTMPVDPMAFATIRAGLGEKDPTLALLERTVDDRWPQSYFLKFFPPLFFEGLESEPRYQALVQRMGLP